MQELMATLNENQLWANEDFQKSLGLELETTCMIIQYILGDRVNPTILRFTGKKSENRQYYQTVLKYFKEYENNVNSVKKLLKIETEDLKKKQIFKHLDEIKSKSIFPHLLRLLEERVK
jgi:hypothetical protein